MNSNKLKKELRMSDVFAITTGTMMSSGIFILPGLAYAKAGPAVIFAYIIAGILTIPGMLSQAELSTAMPKAGGSYFFITRSMGPAVGTVYGIITWFALALKSSFALVGMTVFVRFVMPEVNSYGIAVALCSIFIFINIFGIKGAGRIQSVLVFSILTGLAIFIITGYNTVSVSNLTPFSPNGTVAVLATAGYVFISYGGLLKVASVAEEVAEPGKILPKAMIYSLVVVLFFYIAVLFVTVGTVPGNILSTSLKPISDSAAITLGKYGEIILSIVAIAAFTSAANAGIMSASRYPMALSRDSLLPSVFGVINKRFQTPHFSVLLTGGFIIATLLMDLDLLVKAASSVVILTYLFSCLAVIILRESRLQNYQPQFKSPLYPWIQIFGIIGAAVLIYEIGREALISSAVLILVGFIIYWFYGRRTAKKEFALMHLIERITSRELTSNSLESELKEVIRERDEILKDRFDHLVEASHILDIDETVTMEEFFKKAADELSPSLGMEETDIFKLFMDREADSSTMLTPGLAIPHIVIEGEKKFELLIARCKDGISFGDGEVYAAFVLIGSKDERNFHLRALSAIAQLVQDENFEKRWMDAKNTHGLRDIILLSKRRR